MKRKRPTIVDVAREAGVSIGTVSHVCNGSAKVRAKTRERVEAAMRRLAYRPNALARSLISLGGVSDGGERLKLPHLITVGYISVDYMARVDVLPHRDDRITAHHIEKALGGPAANVAAAAAALGGDCALDVELATAIGDDADSEWALAELSRKNVHALPIRRPYHNRLSRCFVIVEANGSRTIINEPFELTETDLAAHLPVTEESRPCCLHVEGYHVGRMQNTIARFRRSGWKVSLHTTGLPAKSCTARDFAALLDSHDLIFVNAETARAVLGLRAGLTDIVEAFASYLATCPNRGSVVLTLAERGAALFRAGDAAPLHLSAMPVEVIDATGAGDTFAGVFLGLWLHGRDLAEAARYANVAAALAVTAEGAQARLTSVDEIEALLAGSEDPGALGLASVRESA